MSIHLFNDCCNCACVSENGSEVFEVRKTDQRCKGRLPHRALLGSAQIDQTIETFAIGSLEND
jgi:hypothetical protein